MDVLLELVPNRVFFQIRADNPFSGIHMNEKDGFIYHYHSMDNLYKSMKIRKYFGPMTLSNIHRHCVLVDKSLKHTAGRHLFYTNSFETLSYQQKRTNAIFLMGCYLILRQSLTPEQTKDMLHDVTGSVALFTDMEGSTAHALTLLDCWRALYHAMVVNQWFQKRDFDMVIDLFDGSDDVINWIVPGRLLALEDPKEPRYMGRGPRVRYSIVDIFKQHKVNTVVRLNGRDYEYRTSYGQPYDSEEFVCRAIKHYDIFFKDGGIPSESQLNTFLKIVKKAHHPIAVHCHAGRGRTGTMLACSLVRFWGFEAVHAIAWVRICRAASVVGIQQGFVKMVENSLRQKACNQALGQTGNKTHGIHTSTKHPRQIHVVLPPRGQKRPTPVRSNPSPAKSTSNKKSEQIKQSNEKSLNPPQKITILPMSGAMSGIQLRRQRAKVHAKVPKNKTRVCHELTLRSHSRKSEQKPQGMRVKSPKQTKTTEPSNVNSVTKVSLNTNAQLRMNDVLDLNLLKNLHMFQEQEPKNKYLRANISDKVSCYIGKPGQGNYFHQPKRHTVDTSMAARLEAMLHFQNKPTKCEQYELKQKSKAQDDPAKIDSSRSQIRESKSSIPFAKTRIKYSSYQPTFDHLTKLLSFDRESKSPVSSCGRDYKIPTVSTVHGDKGQNPKVEKTVSRNKTERRLAWDEPEVSPQCAKTGSVRVLRESKKDNMVLNDFLDKHRQTLLVSKTANCAGGNRDNGKIRNLHR